MFSVATLVLLLVVAANAGPNPKPALTPQVPGAEKLTTPGEGGTGATTPAAGAEGGTGGTGAPEGGTGGTTPAGGAEGGTGGTGTPEAGTGGTGGTGAPEGGTGTPEGGAGGTTPVGGASPEAGAGTPEGGADGATPAPPIAVAPTRRPRPKPSGNGTEPECSPLDPVTCQQDLLEICAFVTGTYKCQCPPNFSRTSDGKCLIANECFDFSLNNCSKDAVCKDDPIGYTCACKPGFVDASSEGLPGRTCVAEKNQCKDPTAVTCDQNAECIEKPVDYECKCKAGFGDVSAFFNLAPGRRCVKVGTDFCDNSTSPKLNDCSPNAICRSSDLSFTCECNPGFVDVSPHVSTLPGRNCQPMKPPVVIVPGDKCDPANNSTTQCPNGRVCMAPENGTASCMCPLTALELEGGFCFSNDCEGPNVDCDPENGLCVNLLVGYTCQCKAGYKDASPNPNQPGRKCVLPVNECTNETLHDCHHHAVCLDRDPGYDCQCKDGYADVGEVYNLLPGRACIAAKNPCSSNRTNDCDVNAKCIPALTETGYVCVCEDGYVDVSVTADRMSGRVCTLNTHCPGQQTDLIFLVDGSASVSEKIFKNDVLPFVAAFSKIFSIGPTQTRVGVIQFAHAKATRVEFALNTHSDAASVVRAVKQIKFIGGGTQTASAIRFMLRQGFTEKAGARPAGSKARRVAVVITDGRSTENDPPSILADAASEARRQGVLFYAVGVTKYAVVSELMQIAGDKDRFVVVQSFKELDEKLRARVQAEICPEVRPPPGRKCTSDDDCDRTRNEICANSTCTCPPSFCQNPESGQCGPVTTCDPASNATCPSPLVCKETPLGYYRCACPHGHFCDAASGDCFPPEPPPCNEPQVLNPSLAPPACENCNPFCDWRRNEICIKDAQGFRCDCRPRYVRDPRSKLCVSDKCKTNDCDKNAICFNTFDSYFCTCPFGFRDDSVGFPGRNCTKIVPPCSAGGSNNCSKDATCVSPGHGTDYSCQCKNGFWDAFSPTGTFAGHDCQPDVDECTTGKHNCSKDATCTNLQIGYTCACKPGFDDFDLAMPGRNCKAPPTPTPTPTTTKPPPRLCIQDQMYCGTELLDMGYTKADPNTLYECDDDGFAMYYQKCSSGNCTATSATVSRSFCPCNSSTNYCGFEFRMLNLITAFAVYDHDLYFCSNPHKKLEVCPAKCALFDETGPSHCAENKTNVCEKGKKYCGMQLTWLGIGGDWTPNPHMLYECLTGIVTLGTMRPLERCRSGCDWQKGECTKQPEPPVRPPGFPTKPPTTTVPVTTPTTPPPPKCNILDPLACDQNKSEVCSFVNGTFDCTCRTNFTRLPDGRCLVANECEIPYLNDCSPDADCTDEKIGFFCTCKKGFADASDDPVHRPGRICKKEITECDSKNLKCDKNAECKKDKNGVASCVCKSGFEDVSEWFNLFPGQRCKKVGPSPCNDTKLNDCSPFAKCHPFKLGYVCHCLAGYIDVSPNPHTQPGRNCVPRIPKPPTEGKECDFKANVTGCPQGYICPDTNGTKSRCQCPPGTVELQGDICHPIDICLSPMVDCDAIGAHCNPTPDSFTCQCRAGFKDISPNKMLPGRVCVEPVNECANVTLNDCSPQATCFDTDPDYECRCNEGYSDVSHQYNEGPGRRCINGTNPCLSTSTNKCHQNAKCIPTLGGSYICQCEEGYVDLSTVAKIQPGRICVINSHCHNQATDLVFLVDGSSSVTEPYFQADVLPFVRDFVDLFEIGASQTRVAFIQFSDKVRTEFLLDKYQDKKSVQDAISKITFLKGETRTGAAIKFMLANAFNEKNGARPLSSNVHRIAIVITDGKSWDVVTGPAAAARRAGLSVYAVGVGPSVRATELEQIAGDKARYSIVQFFTELDANLKARIQAEICPEVWAPPGKCSKNSQCDRGKNEICLNGTCGCPQGFCRSSKTNQCGLISICDPKVNVTCPSPLVCKLSPYGIYRCACPDDEFACDASGTCMPKQPSVTLPPDVAGVLTPLNPPKCAPPQILNPSVRPFVCENCNPFCDDRKNEYCDKVNNEYKCLCKAGFVRDPKSKLCISDKCAQHKPCDPAAKCDNTFDDFVCTCPPGFRDVSPGFAWPGFHCVEVPTDPCSNSTCAKDSECVPTPAGDFNCECPNPPWDVFPFVHRWSGAECRADNNECTKGSPTCSKDATCVDLHIDYTCTCKKGFEDMNIREPGRTCAPPPTIPPTTPTTPKGPTLCQPGRMYCGQQLIDLGYTKVDKNTLYECSDDQDGLYYKKCPVGECNYNNTMKPYCPCEEDLFICGHELRMLNTPSSFPFNDQELYACAEPPTRQETCVGKCTPANKKTDQPSQCEDTINATCEIGRKYCGLEITWAGITTWTPQPHILFTCSDGTFGLEGMTFVERCRSGCVPGEPSKCDPTPPVVRPNGATPEPTEPPPTPPPPKPFVPCTSGRFYCGAQLAEMGYDNTDDGTLYECNQDNNGLFYRKCEVGCANTSKSASCTCQTGKKVCGYDLQKRNVEVPGLVQHGLYQCLGEDAGVETIRECTRCISKNGEADCTEEPAVGCDMGANYCGFDVMKATTSGNTTIPHLLLLCSKGSYDEMDLIERCDSGCVSGGSSAQCDNNRVALKPSNGVAIAANPPATQVVPGGSEEPGTTPGAGGEGTPGVTPAGGAGGENGTASPEPSAAGGAENGTGAVSPGPGAGGENGTGVSPPSGAENGTAVSPGPGAGGENGTAVSPVAGGAENGTAVSPGPGAGGENSTVPSGGGAENALGTGGSPGPEGSAGTTPVGGATTPGNVVGVTARRRAQARKV